MSTDDDDYLPPEIMEPYDESYQNCPVCKKATITITGQKYIPGREVFISVELCGKCGAER